MKLLLKKAERKKRRRKNHYSNDDDNRIEINQLVDSKIKENISILSKYTNCDLSLYNKSNIISNIDDFNYKSLDYILDKYQ